MRILGALKFTYLFEGGGGETILSLQLKIAIRKQYRFDWQFVEQDPIRATLSRLVPSVGRFHTPLRLVDALFEYDEFAHITRRKYIPPNFAEIRHILNLSQLHAVAEKLKLITFDADGMKIGPSKSPHELSLVFVKDVRVESFDQKNVCFKLSRYALCRRRTH